MADQEPRVWGGTTLDARRAERRARILDAAFMLMGEGGSAAVTVRGVCRATKLSERYFYESFSDREELVLAVYDTTVERAQHEIVDAADKAPDVESSARATMDAYMRFLEDDPRRARILLQEPVADPALARHRSAVLPSFAELLKERFAALPDGPDDKDADLTAAALVGAVVMLYLGYLDGSLDVSRERVIDHASQVLARSWSIRSCN